jgi:ketosteroid isomerase-like protein
MSDTVRATINEFTDCLNRHDAAAAVQFLAEDVVFWEPSYTAPRRGRDAIRRELEGFFAMLPDIKFTSLTLLAEGEYVSHEWQYQATYQGRLVELRECSIARLDDEARVVEVRVYFDRLTLLRQLGLAPAE